MLVKLVRGLTKTFLLQISMMERKKIEKGPCIHNHEILSTSPKKTEIIKKSDHSLTRAPVLFGNERV